MPGGLKTAPLSLGTTRGSAATFTNTPTSIRPERNSTVSVFVNATAVSGTTPSLVVSLEWSHDGTSFVPADPADALTAITAVGGLVKDFTVKAPFMRVKEVVTGTTPSITRDINVTYY
jgi:hypothetical protein